MKITVNQEILFPVLDTLLERWQAKKFPYRKRDAVIPQNEIPAELRKDKKALALFYFYICIYMRGGIESRQAFQAVLRMWRKYPHLFDPYYIHGHWMKPEDLQPILKEYVGWDSKAASINWVTNSRHLVEHWGGNPLNLIKGLADYDEAIRRIRNKRTKADLDASGGLKYAGFRGFQPKMVSMLIYFYDWEGWLNPRFLFPAPVDFHNFRLGLNQGAIILPEGTKMVRGIEALSRRWRDALMDYLRSRNADPVELADCIWMFSLVMCGNSPLNTTKEERTNGSGMFDLAELPHVYETPLSTGQKEKLRETCLRCPLLSGCTLSIPSRPYYRKGELVLKPRLLVEKILPTIDPDFEAKKPEPHPELPFTDPGA